MERESCDSCGCLAPSKVTSAIFQSLPLPLGWQYVGPFPGKPGIDTFWICPICAKPLEQSLLLERFPRA
jgi:hypothetical protein